MADAADYVAAAGDGVSNNVYIDYNHGDDDGDDNAGDTDDDDDIYQKKRLFDARLPASSSSDNGITTVWCRALKLEEMGPSISGLLWNFSMIFASEWTIVFF